MEPPFSPKTTFIYALTEPTGEIRYIGKSNAPARRFSKHLQERGENYKVHWIQSLRSQGICPLWKILDEVPVEYWQQWEAAYIQFFSEEGCKLTNGTKGGEGADSGHTVSLETRKKIGDATRGNTVWRGRKHTDASKKLIGEGNRKALLGRKATPEAIENMQKAQQERRRNGESLSLVMREKISLLKRGNQYFLGHKHTQSAKEKVSVAMKGNQHWLGRKHSETTKEKMRHSHRALQKEKAL